VVRISRLEHLDEIEELELVLEHYSVTWGYSDRIASGENGGTNSLRQWDLALQIRPVEDDE
jgi:hypothetical protein